MTETVIDYSLLTDEEKRELLRLKELRQNLLAKDSLEIFAEKMLDLSPAEHHKLVIEELEGLERGDYNVLFLFLPPGSAKSTFGSVVFPSWYTGRNRDRSIISTSHTKELAERFGRRTRNMVSDPEFSKIFGGMTVSKDSSAAGRWETSNGCEYYSCGLGGSITGRRADLGIIDDPVASREAADSETMREKAWEWFINDFMTRLKPNAKLLFIMTRWHEDDLGGRALEYFGDKARVVKLPMEAYENDPLGREVGERLWPEWYTDEMIELAQQDERSWLALYQQEPRPVGGGEFKKHWIHNYQGINHHLMNKIILVDSSSGKKKKKNVKELDFTSMWVIGLATDQNYYVLDIVRDRLNLTERSEMLFKLHRKWTPGDVRYEEYGLMSDIEHIQSEMNRKQYRFSITAVAGSMAKEDRIRRLIPLFQMGRVWFPLELYYTTIKGEVVELVDTFIRQEYLPFPVARFDDMFDSLARVAEPHLDLPWPTNQTQAIPNMTYNSMADLY